MVLHMYYVYCVGLYKLFHLISSSSNSPACLGRKPGDRINSFTSRVDLNIRAETKHNQQQIAVKIKSKNKTESHLSV